MPRAARPASAGAVALEHVTLALCILAAPLGAKRLSPGCNNEEDFLRYRGKPFWYDTHMEINHWIRKFAIFIPESYDNKVPLPLMVYLHGQGGNAMASAQKTKYKEYPMISAYPQGADDHATRDCGTGWNVGEFEGHDPSTCSHASFNRTCCYRSCLARGVCKGDGESAQCGWATCQDDVSFVDAMLKKISRDMCVDLDRFFITGASNGGMMTHALTQRLPGRFRAAVPIYGLPLRGHSQVPPGSGGTSILHLHGRSDTVIPLAGGHSGDGWLYESVDSVLAEWARFHRCDEEATPILTKFDGGSNMLACSEFSNCQGSGFAHRVMRCYYDGVHGDWPKDVEALSYWFFKQRFERRPDEDGGVWQQWALPVVGVLAFVFVVSLFINDRCRHTKKKAV